MERIVGVETEYGVTATRDGARTVTADAAARALFRPMTDRFTATNLFLPNGGRLYLDVGSHPEYATAECARWRDLLAQDRAGERLLVEMADAAAHLPGNEAVGTLRLYKNNTDAHGNSYGCHENYLVRRTADFGAQAAALLPFLVTRQLICGAGKVHVVDGRGRFEVSQRAAHMLDSVSSSTTRSRPMINSRDEPHADPRRHRRLHVIVGDSNLSEVSTLLKLASTELVLRVVEERGAAAFAAWELADPLAAIRACSADITGRGRVELADGRVVTALELQAVYVEAVRGLGELDAEAARALALWEKVIEALAGDDLGAVATEVDWVAKLGWLRRFARRHDIPDSPAGLADPRIAQLDLAWHEVTDGGVFRLLEAKGRMARITTDADVRAAMTTAPATRARLRGRLVQAARDHDRQFSVDWSVVGIGDLPDGTVHLPDPFATDDERVDRLLERMATEPRSTLPYRFSTPPAP